MDEDFLTGPVDEHERIQRAVPLPKLTTVEDHMRVERPGVAGVAPVMRRFGRRFKVDNRCRIIFADTRINHGNGSTRWRIVRREGSDHERVITRDRLGLENRFGEDHVVTIERSLVTSVRQDGPEALDDQRVAIDIFPAAKEDAPVREYARIKLSHVVHGDGVDVTAIRVHHMQDGHTIVGAGNKTTIARRGEDNSAIRHITGFHIVMSSATALVRIAVVVEIGDLTQT